MIALSGCARRNADRELARVLAFLDRQVVIARAAKVMADATDTDADFEEWLARRIEAIRDELERLAHRTP